MSNLPRENIESIAKITLDHFGIANQLDVAQEELSELVIAISHYRRGREDKYSLIEEIAGVHIMMQQLRQVFGRQEVDDAIQLKLRRLKDKVRAERSEQDSSTLSVIGASNDGNGTIQSVVITK